MLYEAYITHACAQVLPVSWLGPTEHFVQSHLAHLGWCCLGPLGQPGHFLMAISGKPENKQQIKRTFSMSASIVMANTPLSTASHKAKPSVGDGTECKHRVEHTAILHGKGQGYNGEITKLRPFIQSVRITL